VREREIETDRQRKKRYLNIKTERVLENEMKRNRCKERDIVLYVAREDRRSIVRSK
jgi:hypothetical protein